jgi:hypothetical protein
MDLRKALALGMAMMLAGCTAERHFGWDSLLVFGNPNAPAPVSETAQRALGNSPPVAPLTPQAGNVWPGPVAPMPTLSQVQKFANLPLGQGYIPSLPSPYPPGQAPKGTTPDGSQTSSVPAITVPPLAAPPAPVPPTP